MGEDKGKLCGIGDIYLNPNGWRGSQETLFGRMPVGEDIQNRHQQKHGNRKAQGLSGEQPFAQFSRNTGEAKRMGSRLEALARIRS